MFNSEKCVQLAVKAHLDYTAKLVCSGNHREVIEVPTRDRSGIHNVVHVYGVSELYCDCIAASQGLNCCHAGAAIVLLNARAECYAA